ncbi:MAG: hypothetical protein OEY14_14130, partial [Myxococcales bacterium]|nr:hypothetical protein [Myxococcales bacterium]
MKVDSTSKVGAAEALARLAAGNERFVRGESLQPESHAERRKALIKAQAPFAVVLTCSDSRVVPELIFDQGIGDLFVLRVAGNIIDDAVLGTVEYAVGELGVQLVVVMGHQTCGAVSAAMQAAQRLPGESASGAPQPAQTLNPRTRDPGPRVQGAAASRGAVSHLDELIRAISPAVARSGGDLETAIRLNATDVSETLRTHGMVLGPAIETGALAIVPAYYSLDTGTVEFLKAGELEPRADPRVPMGTEAHALLRETRVLLDLRAESLEGLVLEGLHHLREAALLTNEEERRVRNRLRASGEPVPAADLGHGVGVIRVIAPELRRPRIVLANCPRSRFGLPEGTPWAFLWIVIGPAEVEAPSNEELEPFGWMLLDDRFIGRALEALAKGELLDAYAEYLAFVETPIEREEIPPELERSGRLFGGILNDVKRRLPSYGSDWRDGFHPKILASVLFLFFACFAPAVAFGGLLSVLTEGSIGAVEMILATFVCGTVYALASGQPMTILGSTGPVIVFMGIVYELCRSLDIPYFPTLACIGLWTALILIILAATDASRLIRHFTRFTDETFAALIALIFVVEALRDTFKGFASPEIPYDTALLSLVLAIGTYAIATQLSRFRR